MKKLTLLVLAICASFTMNAQTADEILATYFENIGGLENLKQVFNRLKDANLFEE